MSTKGVLPPPPGVQPNFENPPSRRAGIIALHTICLFLVTVSVGVRFYTRRFINHHLGIDDCFCAFSYVLTLAFSGLMIWGIEEGVGRHLWDEPVTKVTKASKALAISEWVYMPLVASIKLSCLFFFRRVFSPSRKITRFVDGGIIVISCAYIAIFFATVFDCVPVSKSWHPSEPGRCARHKILPYTSGTINVTSDIYVLILPVPCIWGLNMRLSRKLRIMIVFSLGAFACAASVVRLGMTSILYISTDRFWNTTTISIYTVLEINVGIICACLLAFPAFLERHGLKSLGSFFSRLLSRTGSWIDNRFSGSRRSRRANAPTESDRDLVHNLPVDLGTSEYPKLREEKSAAEIDMSTSRGKESFVAPQPSPFRQNGSSDDDVEAGMGQGQFQTVFLMAVQVPKRDAYEREYVRDKACDSEIKTPS